MSQPISRRLKRALIKTVKTSEEQTARNQFLESLVHHDLRRLVEAHVPVANEPLGVRGQRLVVPARLQKVDPLVGEPPGDVRGRRHLGDVVPVDFALKKEVSSLHNAMFL